MNKLATCLVAGAVAAGAPLAHAGMDSPHEFSGNATITTDYLFRGASQTNEGPAIQGGFDYTYKPMGLYLGTWASNVEFNILGNTDDASIEMDFYGGFAGDLDNGISWDIGGLYYAYPEQNEDAAADYDLFEVYGGLSYTFANSSLEPTIGVKLSYSPDYFGEDGDSLYPEGSLDLSLPQGFGLGFHVGHLDVDGDKTTGATGGISYTHWSVGLSKELAGFDFGLSYNDAEDDCETDLLIANGLCEAFVFSVSRSF